MNRLLLAIIFVASVLFVLGPSAQAQDAIHYFDRKKQTNEVGKGTLTEETPAEVTFKPTGAGQPIKVRSADITEIEYRYINNDKFSPIEWKRPTNALRQALLEKKPAIRKMKLETSLEAFRALAPLVTDNKSWVRHVQFGIADVLAVMAEDDASQLDPAIGAVKKFKADYGDGWQLVKATKLLVRLLEQKGDEAGAQAAYTDLADNAAAPKDVRQEFGLLVVRYLLRKGKHEEAATRARAVQEGLPAGDPLTMKLKVYLADCDVLARKYDSVEKDLKVVLDSNADNDVKALARNTLGDYFRARGEGDKAFWEYIWVDVHYNQDREELSKALYYLAKLFADVRKDPLRAKECLERLCDEKQFGGLEYHKKALAEKTSAAGS